MKKQILLVLIIFAFLVPFAAADVEVDGHPIGNRDANYDLDALYPGGVGVATAAGQSFNATYTGNLTYCEFALAKTGSPSGNATAILYAHNGVYGTSSVPTGAALATSDPYDVSGLTGAYQMIRFNFSTPYELQRDTKYCIVFQNPSAGTVNATDYVMFGIDANGPHGGNLLRWTNVWSAIDPGEGIFSVYGDASMINIDVDGDALFSANSYGVLNATVYTPLGLTDIDLVTIQVNTTGDAENFTLRYTQTSDTFSEVSDPDNIITLGTCSRTLLNQTHIVFSFNFTFTGGTNGGCDVFLNSTSDGFPGDTDLYSSQFSYSYYNWNSIVYEMINSAFAFWGLTDTLSGIYTYVTGVTSYFTSSLTNMVSLIVLQFSIVTNVFTWLLRWLTRIVNRIVSMFSIIVTILNGTNSIVTGIGSLWDTIQLSQWTDIIVLLAIFTWIESIIRRGKHQGETQVIIGDMQTMANILGYLTGMFTTVINIVVDYTFRLFEAIT